MPVELSEEPVTLFLGSRAACDELRLVLEAAALPYQMEEAGRGWTLSVDATVAQRAREELERYAAERRQLRASNRARRAAHAREPFGGAAALGLGYAAVLCAVAYCAGASLFGADWIEAGALLSPARGPPDWWRAITSLTLHADAAHLAGNLFFGVAGCALCTRLFGYGIAALSILAAGAAANYLEMWIAPAGHQAIGASTAVFASLGLLSGYAWRQRLTLGEQWLYRFTPLIGGFSLLAFLGAGGAHVDVLGHLLGFLMGVALGWGYALADIPRSRRAAPQNAAASLGLTLVTAAWVWAI